MAHDAWFHLLGGFAATVDGRTVTRRHFLRRSGADLVQLLALTERHQLHRERIMDAFWPELSVGAASNQLSKAATFARNALGDKTAIVLKDGIVSLFPTATVKVDFHDVFTVDASDRQAVEDMMASHTGELLPDSPYAEWTMEPRDRLQSFRLGLLRRWSRWAEVLEIEPGDEAAHLGLMAEALERGDRDLALRQYERLERILDEELGVLPSPAATALRDEAIETASGADRPTPAAGLRSFLVAEPEMTTSIVEPNDAPTVDVFEAHDRLVTAAITASGGTVFDQVGHRLAAVFTSASRAVNAAIACQRAVQHADWDGAGRPRTRIAVDLGEAECREGRWQGPVLGRVEQMTTAAWGDQIVCSAAVADLSALDPRRDHETIDVGVYRLTGIAPVRLSRVTTGDLENRRAPLRAVRVGGNQHLVGGDPIFGREVEMNALLEQLADERLVTIVGAGGSGKTHLAKQVGGRLQLELDGGLGFCELGKITEDTAVAQLILSAVGGHVHSEGSVLESIARTVAGAESLLLLDNCEHVTTAVRAVCEELLSTAPGLRILATSRQPIGIAGEQIFPLGELGREASVAMFVAFAKRHGVMLDRHDEAIGRICGRLDDLPLAISLAAARASSLDLKTLESLLDDRFEFLRSEHEPGVPHHRTLRAAIAWSVDALPPEARTVLAALTTFPAGFTLQAAIAVCSEPGGQAHLVNSLNELVRRSLVVRPGRDGRYRLLESVRLFVGQSTEVMPTTAVRYVDYFARRAMQSATTANHDFGAAAARFAEDWDDIRLAITRANEMHLRQQVHRLMAASANFSILTQRGEFLDWCEMVLEPTDRVESLEHGEALLGWSYWLAVGAQHDRAAQIAMAVQQAFPQSAAARSIRGWVEYSQGAEGQGRRWFNDAADSTDPAGVIARIGALVQLAVLDSVDGVDISPLVRRLELMTLGGDEYQRSSHRLATAMMQVGIDPAAALEEFEECIHLADSCDLLILSATARSARAFTLVLTGSIEDAFEGIRQSLRWSSDRGMWSWTVADLPTAAGAFEIAGEADVATMLLSARQATRFAVGVGASSVDQQIERLRAAHGDDFEIWWRNGRHLSPSDATALALKVIDRALSR